MSEHRDWVGEFERALLSLDRNQAEQVLAECIANGERKSPVEELVSGSLERIGTAWENGRVALSQVYMAGRICEELIDRVQPSGATQPAPGLRMAMGVLEDYHALGKRMILSALRASGFDVKDLGSGLSVSDLVEQVLTGGIDVLLVSVLMLRSALKVRELRTGLDALGRRVWLVVGGAPFLLDRDLWQVVGADVMGASTSDAIRIARDLAAGRLGP